MTDAAGSVVCDAGAAARFAAISLRYKVHGSLGLIVRAIRRKQMAREKVLAILRSVPDQSTLYIRPALLEEMIARVEAQE